MMPITILMAHFYQEIGSEPFQFSKNIDTPKDENSFESVKLNVQLNYLAEILIFIIKY